jgi:ActR/RegA family two-component response regulator
VVRAIRAIDPTCVAVILTAYASLESAIDGIHHGVDDYIIKPINADTLATLLTDKMGEHARKHLPRKYPIVN